jgi:hypothetical protein
MSGSSDYRTETTESVVATAAVVGANDYRALNDDSLDAVAEAPTDAPLEEDWSEMEQEQVQFLSMDIKSESAKLGEEHERTRVLWKVVFPLSMYGFFRAFMPVGPWLATYLVNTKGLSLDQASGKWKAG